MNPPLVQTIVDMFVADGARRIAVIPAAVYRVTCARILAMIHDAMPRAQGQFSSVQQTCFRLTMQRTADYSLRVIWPGEPLVGARLDAVFVEEHLLRAPSFQAWSQREVLDRMTLGAPGPIAFNLARDFGLIDIGAGPFFVNPPLAS